MARPPGTFGDIRTSARNQRLLKWLRRKPIPAVVVGETAEGDERRAVVNLTGPTIWSDVISVVRPCVRFEARDKDGETLRALELDPDDPELQAEGELEAAHRIAASVAPGSVPLISVDIPKLVDNLARNMREVAAESAKQQAGAFKEGFTAMTSVVNLCLGLLVRFDERMANIEEQAAQAQPVDTSAPVDQRQQLALMALQKALGNGIPSNGAPSNGLDISALLRMVQQAQPPQQEGE